MRVRPGFGVTAAVASVALAALSLLAPYEPAFDPWAWLIWGRELAGLGLDTSAGASWKPLPALVAAPFSLAGDAAPGLWLLVARAGWIAAALLAGRLAWRLAGGGGAGPRAALAAGAIAAAAVILLDDAFTPWLRQFTGGLAEPLLVAALLGAIEAHLTGRRRLALALVIAASLLRPETWPFLAGYLILLRRRGEIPAAVPWLAGAGVALAWFGPDLLGSGSALTGAERARADNEGPLVNGLESLWRSFNLAPAALVAAAALWALSARRGPGDGAEDDAGLAHRLGLLALGWFAVVFAMSLAGFAALPRFAAPAGALVCVLGGAGLAVGCSRIARGGTPRAAVAVAAVLGLGLAVQAGLRAAELPPTAADAAGHAEDVEALRELVAGVGAARILDCGAPSTSDLLSHSALAWELEVGVGEVRLLRSSLPAGGVALVGPAAPPELGELAAERGRRLGEAGPWAAYAISCTAAVDAGMSAPTLAGSR